ncbi:hypothetical protein PENTCL1PPCAC_2918, partial [Pristionchus entomophagus]
QRSGVTLEQHVHHGQQIIVPSEFLPLVRVDRAVPILPYPGAYSTRPDPHHNLPADSEIDEVQPVRLLLAHSVVGGLDVAMDKPVELLKRVRRLDADHDQ